MQSRPRLNLAGKARRMHHRDRSARLYARQQINEAFENDHEPAVVRLKAPLFDGLQREFIPSADPAFDLTTAGGEMQLELPFDQPAHQDQRPPSVSSRIRDRIEEPVGAVTINVSAKTRRNNLHAAADIPDGFTVGGLLYGCLIGSATAAVILVCLRTLFP